MTFYAPEDGDRVIPVEDIRPKDLGKYLEYRDPETGEGTRGELGDAIAYLVNSTALVRYRGHHKGFFLPLGTLVMIKSDDWKPDTASGVAESDSGV